MSDSRTARTPLPGQSPLRMAEQALLRRAYSEAEQWARTALRQSNDNPQALRLLGSALSGAGRHAEAIAAFERALLLSPDDALIHNSLGACLHVSGTRIRALAAFRRATELAPDLIQSWQNMATLLVAENRVDEALAAIDQVLVRAPRLLSARIARSDILLVQGHRDEVANEYRRMIADHPDSAWPWYGLSNLKHYKLSEADLAQMRRLRAQPNLSEREREVLDFAVARALADNAQYAQSFAALNEANARMRWRIPWNAAAFSAEVDAILAAFSAPMTQASSEQGGAAIFIVSLPRAGSSLVEQILASHPQVEGAGELGDLEQVIAAESARRNEPFAQWARAANAADWQRLGEMYLQRTARWRERKAYFTDKLPSNWRFVGAIRAMLPAAHIVVCRRDPLETAWSCYRQLFPDKGHAWSYDFASIGVYWRDFERAQQHWRKNSPAHVHVQNHEALLADTENEIRSLLDFCRLPFDPACLDFHKTRRSVHTLSATQVREPLRRDTASTAKYGALLNPLRAALGLPLIA